MKKELWILSTFIFMGSYQLLAQTPLIHNPLGTPPTEERFQLLPLQEFLSWNNPVAWGGNDGALWQGNGLSNSVSGGVRGTLGIVSLTVAPELDWSQNLPYDGFAPGTGDYWVDLNRIRRYSESPWWTLTGGQSEIRLNFDSVFGIPLTTGFGTANLWFGPGYRTSILMSDNAPGFPHFDLGFSHPWKTSWGSFQGEFFWGQVAMTNGDKGLYHALVLGYSPPGMDYLTIGGARAFLSPWATISFFKTIESIAPGNLFASGGSDDADQQMSLYFDANFANYGFELYGEFARNDASGNLRDLLLQPDHAVATVWGVRKSWNWSTTAITIGYEQADLGDTIGTNIRPTGSWYRHVGISATNDGQLLGADIGPGSNSNTFDLTIEPEGPWSFGGLYERIAHDVDYTLFGLPGGPVYRDSNYGAINYLDVSTEFQGWISWSRDQWKIKWKFSFIKDLNHEWIPENDINIWRTSLALTYTFS